MFFGYNLTRQQTKGGGYTIKTVISGVFIFFGFVSLGLGILGIVLPLLPTTPLLLLAAFCFVKGSKKFDRWFKQTKLYKKYLEEFDRNRSMTLRQKITINLFADIMIAIAFFKTDILMVRIILLLIIVYKYYYFITKIKTVKER